MTRKVLLALAACVFVAGALVAAIAAAARPQHVRLGGAPRRPAGTTVVGSLPAATSLQLTMTLKPRDPAALKAYATAVSTPGSSAYHHYLSVAEFRQRFGPTASQIASVLASLRAHGLKPGAVTPNGLTIPVISTASTISHAFSTSFQRVRVRGRKAFANTQAPLLDSSIAGLVQGVIGLNSLAVPRPLALRATGGRAKAHVAPQVVTGGPQPCSTATSAAPGQSADTTDQIASAYDFSGLYGAGDEGAGQTVGIFELEGNFHSDITAFESCYGIAASVTYKHTAAGAPSTPDAGNGDGIETELDIENVIGLAPQASVIVYQGPNSTAALLDEYTAMVDDTSINVISTSWGLCEPESDPSVLSSESTLFQEAATQGQSVFAAAGDSGSEDCGDDSLAVDDPASQPFVTGAGGTSLTTLGPPPTESIWNDQCSDGPCGGGGGISTLYTMPSYQSSAPAGLNVVNSNSSGAPCDASAGSFCREVPDVSADADPNTGYLIYWDGNGNATDSAGWIGIGGTSGAAPLWAGLMADVNSSSACSAPVGFANPALYVAAATAYSSDFNDITSGDNALSGSGESLYPAGPDYDMASGLGTPDASHLAAVLCGDRVEITNPGSQMSHVSQSSSSAQLQVDATDSAGNPLTYGAPGLPPGLSIDPSSGLISGDPTTSGTFSVTVTASDTEGASGEVTFTWTIVTPVALTDPGVQTSVAGIASDLQMSGSDTDGQTLSYSTIGLPPGLSVDPTTGAISGEPTSPGTYDVTATVSDPTPYYDSVQFSWTVDPVTVSVSPPGNQVSLVGVPTRLQAHASDNNSGTLSYSATSLPPGLSINGTSGLISGVPTTTGTYPVTLTATDGSYSRDTEFVWTVAAGAVAIANPGRQTGRVWTPARLQINAADNNSGALFYGATGLPPGLSMNASTGLITGTPTSAGSFSVTVAAADGGSSASTRFSWTVSGPPNSSGGALSGIAAGKPKFSLTLSAGTEAPGIKKIVLTLPKSLSFNRNVGKGLKLTGPGGTRLSGFKLSAAVRRLTITLAQHVAHVRIAIGLPAITASKGLIAKVKRRAAGKLTVKLTITDASGHVTTITLKLSPS